METRKQMLERHRGELESFDKLQKITEYKERGNSIKDVYINNRWAYTTYKEEQQGGSTEGEEISGHEAMIYLTQHEGTWYDEEGKVVEGYLFYKPKGE